MVHRRFGSVGGQHVEPEVATRVLEEVLLAPASQHQRSHPSRGNTFRVQAGQNRPLGARRPDHDASPRARVAHLDGVFRDGEAHTLAVPAHLTPYKLVVIQMHFATLIGDEIQPLFDQPFEQLAVKATAIEDHRKVRIADDLAYRANYTRQTLDQVAPDLYGHH